jgi:gluconokinase
LIWSRLSLRTDHYMKPNMLKSQFEALEEPTDALAFHVSLPVHEIVEGILKHIMASE